MKLLLLACLVAGSQAFLFGRTPAWDELRVKFGVPFVDFLTQPRTVQDAVKQGFKLEKRCSESNGFFGQRYVKNGDSAVMLLFDKNGYIAGIQAGVPKNLANGFPSRAVRGLFNDKGSEYVITAYFTNPSKICSEGRSTSQFEREGTGSGLYVQTGPNPRTDIMAVPMQEAQVASTKWTKGKCFVGMGQHYWYNTSEDMDCDNFFPMFLLYKSGTLNGFGWAFDADLSSDMFEHPPPALFSMFMDPVPKCLMNRPTRLSTLHVYMSNPYSVFC